MPSLRVEIIRALPDGAETHQLELEAGATVRGALAAVGITAPHGAGIFGRRVPLDTKLAEGDRVEIYRPLRADPKEARRRRALKRAER
ncbi:MAG TPA: RnfH family protein [Burkholderiales bacterium]|jgi:putative ubiquitin-RnfH superfamily antitoxin RatB of RatAB toxin-antitoxin module|nr:RnfH family protein [Burkholderiales bacterium]